MLLYAQSPHSQGARRLARELGIRRIRHNNSRFSGRRAPWVINWGASAIPLPWAPLVRFLNAPEAVQRVSNKLTFFNDMSNEDIIPRIVPRWTPYKEIAHGWMVHSNYTVVERHVLNGSGGRGIRIVSKDAINPEARELQEAPLYVQYIPKRTEYRVHIFDGEVIDIQQKVARAGEAPLDWRVRSHDNGFIYVRENIHPNPVVIHNALSAMAATNLLFGAVDVIYNERRDRAYVLEINTAPGLEGRTVQSYAQAIREFIQ